MTSFALSVRLVAVGTAAALLLLLPGVPAAHHSFAIYDFDVEIPFEGVVATLSFRNPHVRMTLTRDLGEGRTDTIVFAEGAPANMLVRRGLTPDMISPGTRITAVGSPRLDNPEVYFLRLVRLEDGREF